MAVPGPPDRDVHGDLASVHPPPGSGLPAGCCGGRNPKPQTPNPKPQTLSPKPEALSPKPYALRTKP